MEKMPKKRIYGIFACCVLLVALAVVPVQQVRAQQIAVNTDLLMDVMAVPSVGVEMTMARQSTLNLNVMASPKVAFKFGKMFAVQPEWRYYFSGRPMYRHFVGVGAVWTDYDMTVKGRRYDGNGSGIGLSFGYVLPIGKRVSVDFHSCLGGFFYKHKEYRTNVDYVKEYADEDGNVPANANGAVLMPLRLGVSLTYILK